MKSIPVYLSMFWYGTSRTVCSEHKSLKAAKRSAKLCEKKGGAKHFFWKIKQIGKTEK